MKVSIQSVNFNADKKLVNYVEKKSKGLEKFYDKIIGVEVFLKVQKINPGVLIMLLVHQKVGGILMLLKKTEKQRIHYQ